MTEEIGDKQMADAMVRVSDLVKGVYEKDKADFALQNEDRTRLEFIFDHLTDYVRVITPFKLTDEAQGKLKSNLTWLWGVVLSHSIPMRRTLSDARFNKELVELAWIEQLATDRAEDVPVHECGNCGRSIPGTGFALCAQCQIAGHRECRNCEKRVASVTNPYCDVCAEEIQGGG